MTTIAAVVKDGYVCIASESQTTFGRSKIPPGFLKNDEKLFKWGKSIIGLSGSVSMQMVLQDLIKNYDKKPDFSSVYSIYKFFHELHPILKKDYFIREKDEDSDDVESSRFYLLIINKHGIFELDPMREVSHYDHFWSIGSGTRYALGAMHSVYKQKGFDAVKIAKAGVSAGLTFDVYSGGNIVYKRIKLAK